jgi:outer membrane protein, heavy metal efflux system
MHRPLLGCGRLEAVVTPIGRGRLPVHRALLALPLALLGQVPNARAQAPPPAPPVPITLTLADATARALSANPTYLARSLDLGLAGTDIAIARERPNPDFLYENTRDAPTSAFVFTLPVELGGKRGRRIAVGEAGRDVVKADLARETADLRNDIRHAFYRLLAADRRIAVAGELAVVAARARDAARARFESGEAPKLDQVQAELAYARVQNAAQTAAGERAALEDELDGLIGVPPGTPLTLVGDLFSDGLDAATTEAKVAPDSVDVVAAARRTAAANATIGLARSGRVPDIALEGGLTYDAPPDFTYGWKLGASMTVPLFTTHRASLTRAEQAATQAVRLEVAASADAGTRLAAAARRASALGDAVRRTSRDILPAAATVNDMAQASYEAGQTGMVSLLQSLQTVAETRLDAVETALAFQLALADLERARGVSQP